MMERFNFLDLFGYLIPGATLLAVVWLPFGLTNNVWPPSELATGIAALGLAYVLGHLLQGLARLAFPSTDENNRYPSDWLLDDHDPRALPKGVRQILVLFVARRFAISLRGNGQADRAVRARRGTAFHLCRSALIQKQAAAYVEQFEGMYFLTRGLAAAFSLGAVYLSGWLLAILAPPGLLKVKWAFIVVVVGAAAAATRLPPLIVSRGPGFVTQLLDRWGLWAVGAVLLVVGAFKIPSDVAVYPGWGIGLAGLVSVFAAPRCLRSSGEFQRNFAKAVWHDFIALETQTPRDLFAELTAQGAFERWLARAHSAAASGDADWIAAEDDLKAGLERKDPAQAVREIVAQKDAKALEDPTVRKTAIDSLDEKQGDNAVLCLTTLAIVSTEGDVRRAVCEKLDEKVAVDRGTYATVASYLQIWRSQGELATWRERMDEPQTRTAARLEAVCRGSSSLAVAVNADVERPDAAAAVHNILVLKEKDAEIRTKLESLSEPKDDKAVLCLTTLAIVLKLAALREAACKHLDTIIAADQSKRATVAAYLQVWSSQGELATWSKRMDKPQILRAARLEAACRQKSSLAIAVAEPPASDRPSWKLWGKRG